MNPLKETLITNYIYKSLPYGGTVTRALMKELYEEYKRLQERNNSFEEIARVKEELRADLDWEKDERQAWESLAKQSIENRRQELEKFRQMKERHEAASRDRDGAYEALRKAQEQITSLRSVLAYYSDPLTYQALNGIDVLKDAGKRARAVTGISSISEKLPGNPEEETI